MENVEETKPVDDAQSSQQTNPDDLFKRVSSFKPASEDKQKDENIQEPSKGGIDQELISKIDAIEDPDLREQFSSLRKSLISGTNDKFQDLAAQRKELQELKQKVEASTQQEWTPERIQSLMNDPKFVQAAKQVAGDSDDYESDDSYMSDEDKQRVIRLEKELAVLKQQNNEQLTKQQQEMRNQLHAQYEAKYSNYDRQEIDIITSDMLEGKIQGTPDLIYKAFKHDDNVKNAYEMGRRDEREGIHDKVESSSATGITTKASSEPVQPKENESSMSLWNRIVEKNLKTIRKQE